MASDGRPARIEIVPFGEAAFLVSLDAAPTIQTTRRVHALAQALRGLAEREPAWRTPVPGLASVLVPFDALAITDAEAREQLAELVDEAKDDDIAPPLDTVTMNVRYGGADGPDLDEVAARLEIPAQAVVELHASATYDVLILGFAPGFAYLGTLPERLSIPRRDTPRTRVPAGSVAIAGWQTAVYPGGTAGGWHVIGRTKTRVWDASREPPALLAPGMRVRFVPEGGRRSSQDA